jgi:lipopolysaccharide export system permease protein
VPGADPGLAVAWAGGLLLVAGWLAPMALERTGGLMADAARHALVAGLQPGQFESMDQGRLTIYVGRGRSQRRQSE